MRIIILRTTGYVEEEELCTRLQSAMNSFNSLVATNRAEAERRFNFFVNFFLHAWTDLPYDLKLVYNTCIYVCTVCICFLDMYVYTVQNIFNEAIYLEMHIYISEQMKQNLQNMMIINFVSLYYPDLMHTTILHFIIVRGLGGVLSDSGQRRCGCASSRIASTKSLHRRIGWPRSDSAEKQRSRKPKR